MLLNVCVNICEEYFKHYRYVALAKLKDNDWSSHFSKCSIKECIDTALSEYCFRQNERDLIEIKEVSEFKFYGNCYLVIHILYNLMRNAFSFISKREKRPYIALDL